MPVAPVRTCLGCQQSDDDPKHVIDIPGAEVAWHMDCHAAVGSGFWGAGGCPTCTDQLSTFTGQGGKALRKHILGGK